MPKKLFKVVKETKFDRPGSTAPSEHYTRDGEKTLCGRVIENLRGSWYVKPVEVFRPSKTWDCAKCLSILDKKRLALARKARDVNNTLSPQLTDEALGKIVDTVLAWGERAGATMERMEEEVEETIRVGAQTKSRRDPHTANPKGSGFQHVIGDYDGWS